MYLIPKGTIDTAAMAMIARAGAPFVDPIKLAEMFALAPSSMLLAQVDFEQVAILTRYNTQFSDEPFTIVMGVPGLVYRSDWMMTAAQCPRIDWTEFEGKLAKSGLTAMTSRESETRAAHKAPIGAMVLEDDGVEPEDSGAL